ncbi:MAG TPA: (d)CMP kinase [Actinomycetota bacterium]|nr:(d)CMP kinase [Actinomycetota bacterium]
MSVLAIDGPAGAGKSTVAREVARRLGWQYLDTGAMYRTVALAALRAGMIEEGPDALGSLARSLDISLDDGCVRLDEEDVTMRIREEDVTAAAAIVAAHAPVRAALLPLQRKVLAGGEVVIEGRDIGVTVAPDAPVKVFLTASPQERARRRGAQLGVEDHEELERLAHSIKHRDTSDSTRAASPLALAEDAIIVDTTGMSLDDTVSEVLHLVSKAIGRG